jgi:RNA exonuclease 4
MCHQQAFCFVDGVSCTKVIDPCSCHHYQLGRRGFIGLYCFVRSEQFVVDYRTHVSGITKEDLESEYAISFYECQWLVAELIHDKVLVGHALKNDLRVLGIQHPWCYTRDTAKYEPFMKRRFEDGILWPRKLKDLAKEILGRDIQQPGHPHSAFEDALAALDLYKKKRTGWEKVVDYKVNKMIQMCCMTMSNDDEEMHPAYLSPSETDY